MLAPRLSPFLRSCHTPSAFLGGLLPTWPQVHLSCPWLLQQETDWTADWFPWSPTKEPLTELGDQEGMVRRPGSDCGESFPLWGLGGPGAGGRVLPETRHRWTMTMPWPGRSWPRVSIYPVLSPPSASHQCLPPTIPHRIHRRLSDAAHRVSLRAQNRAGYVEDRPGE